MRICITGFTGWGNSGDEGILQAIMDELGTDNEYIVCTSLPFDTLANYKERLPAYVADVRQIYDVRDDYDTFILGGGALGWGFGWRQALNAFANDKPSVNYGVGYRFDELFSPRLSPLYLTFLEQFSAITVRDVCSQNMVRGMDEPLGIRNFDTILTGCPSLSLREEKVDCPKGMIAVCPRYEDYPRENTMQLDWLTNRLGDEEDVLLIPFAPYNPEHIPVDLALCMELKKRLKHATLFPTDGYSPRQVKYAISQSRLVITGGRYHAIVWATAHSIPFEVCPTSWHYPKISAFEQMFQLYGGEKLKEMERKNVEIFRRVTNE